MKGQTVAAPAEIPVISEVRRMLETGESARAILVGFETAIRDFEATFGFEPPLNWTYSDIFRFGVRPDMGYAPVLLARLYRVYEPVRYGKTRNVPAGDVVETLRQLYDQPALLPIQGLEPGLPVGVRRRGRPVNSPDPIPSGRRMPA